MKLSVQGEHELRSEYRERVRLQHRPGVVPEYPLPNWYDVLALTLCGVAIYTFHAFFAHSGDDRVIAAYDVVACLFFALLFVLAIRNVCRGVRYFRYSRRQR